MNALNKFEKLIDMAQKASENITVLDTKTNKAQTKIFVCLMTIFLIFISVGVNWFEDASDEIFITTGLLLLLVVVGSLYFFFLNYKQLSSLKKLKNSETKILKNLLNMVYEYKDHLHQEDLSFVERAIIDMKLERIQFSAA